MVNIDWSNIQRLKEENRRIREEINQNYVPSLKAQSIWSYIQDFSNGADKELIFPTKGMTTMLVQYIQKYGEDIGYRVDFKTIMVNGKTCRNIVMSKQEGA